MAEKATPEKAAKPKKEKAPKKPVDLDNLRKKLAPFAKDIFTAYEAMEQDHGSHVLTINHKFDKAAENTGFPKSLLRSEIARMRRKQKEEEKEQSMAEEEREDIERFRDAMEGTPFGKWAEGELAPTAAGG